MCIDLASGRHIAVYQQGPKKQQLTTADHFSYFSLAHSNNFFLLEVVHLIIIEFSLAFSPFSPLPTLKTPLKTTQTRCQTKTHYLQNQMVLTSYIRT